MAVATKIDPSAIYVCAIAHLSGPNAAATQEGEELKGSDPRVQAAPRYFVEQGTPKAEWPTEVDDAVATNEANARAVEEEKRRRFEAQAKANPVKIEAPLMVKAKRDIVGVLDGQAATVKKGSTLPVSHPFVVENLDSFS